MIRYFYPFFPPCGVADLDISSDFESVCLPEQAYSVFGMA